MKRVGILRDPLFLLHVNDGDHLESPDRLRAIDAALQAPELRGALVEIPGRDAAREELRWVHEKKWIEAAEQTRGVPRTMFDPDTSANEHSFDAAVRAAGGVISCVEAAATGGLAAAFALVRPPGHHAESDRAMGFCLFNNAAVAAEFALRRLGLPRVLVVDWDVHHGNGTMHSFYESDQVLFFSTHQFPHYPGSGRVQEIGSGRGRGYTVNVPLPPGQGDEEYAAIFEQVLRPIAAEFAPQLILVSAGFDISRGDPLGDMEVTPAGFSRMTRLLMDLASEHCPGRLVFTLEGGYRLDALAGGVSAVLTTLAGAGAAGTQGQADDRAARAVSAETQTVIEAVRAELRPFWKMLR
jgi:acetoin utilization deacetylase AcuC-like enzyme